MYDLSICNFYVSWYLLTYRLMMVTCNILIGTCITRNLYLVCNMPERTSHHVKLCVWMISSWDTRNDSFIVFLLSWIHDCATLIIPVVKMNKIVLVLWCDHWVYYCFLGGNFLKYQWSYFCGGSECIRYCVKFVCLNNIIFDF